MVAKHSDTQTGQYRIISLLIYVFCRRFKILEKIQISLILLEIYLKIKINIFIVTIHHYCAYFANNCYNIINQRNYLPTKSRRILFMKSRNTYDFTQLGQAEDNQQTVVLRKAYSLLGLSFLPCAAGAYAGNYINFYALFSNSWLSVVAFFILAYGLMFAIEKNRYNNLGIALLMVFTFVIGFFISPLLQLAVASAVGSQIVGMAALMTAAVFFTMATIAHRSKSEMKGIGQFLVVGAVVLIIGMILNMFMHLPVLSLTIAAGFVIFSSLMIMWQIRTVIAGGEDSATSAALTLFVSLYNIFTSLIQILLAIMDNR